jgi:molybdopterin synthase catalytic subunit
MGSSRGRLTRNSIAPEDFLSEVFADSAGGTVLFVGTIRNSGNKGRVDALEYQAYRPMAEKRIREIESETKKKWPIRRIRIVHRYGLLKVGEVSVVVAVSSEHRAEAFAACRYAIDRVKASVPIWKKEKLKDTGFWVEGTPIQR